MSHPRECPRCGGGNIRSLRDGTRRAKASGRAVVRMRRCSDCGFEAATVEFWAVGDYLADIAIELAGISSALLR